MHKTHFIIVIYHQFYLLNLPINIQYAGMYVNTYVCKYVYRLTKV